MTEERIEAHCFTLIWLRCLGTIQQRQCKSSIYYEWLFILLACTNICNILLSMPLTEEEAKLVL